MFKKIHVIVIGTDPQSGRGGIANALPGYFYSLEQANISYKFIPTHHATAPGGKWLYWLKAFPQIYRQIQSATQFERKAILYIHVGGGLVSFIRKTSIAFFAKLYGCPVTMQIHSAKVASKFLSNPLGKAIFKLMVSTASSLCVLTPWWKKLLIETGINKPLFVIPNPLDKQWEEIAQIPKSISSNHQEITILTMTRIEEGKGVDLVIEALPYLPNFVRLIIAGDGILLPTFKERATALSLSHRVDFVGWVSNEQKLSLLQSSDIFCLPSSNDSFGMVFLEAMAHGLPIIALDWGPICDVVPDELCGVLIRQKEPKQLSEAILKLINDSTKRAMMSRNGQKWILERFKAEIVGKEIGKAMMAIC